MLRLSRVAPLLGLDKICTEQIQQVCSCVTMGARRIFFRHETKRFFLAVEPAVELRVFDRSKNVLEQRSGRVTCRDQIVAVEQWLWPHLFRWQVCHVFASEIVHTKTAMARFTVQPVQFQMLIELWQADKFFER